MQGINGRFYILQDSAYSAVITAQVSGLEPGDHGVHVHELPVVMGDCMTTGEHYNPTGAEHGGRDTEERHAGDLGNINADSMGRAGDVFESSSLRLFGAQSVVGRSIVVHAGQDDLGQGENNESRENGNSGERIACCTITLLNSH